MMNISIKKMFVAIGISYFMLLSNSYSEQTSNLTIFARLTKNGKIIESNILWRVFAVNKHSNADNKINLKKFKEIQHSNEARPVFKLVPGDYYVQGSFGRISAIKNIHIEAGKNLNSFINLNAGALEMKALVINGTIDTNKKLNFAIYNDESENDTYSLLDKIKEADLVVPLENGFYHLVSRYGDVNSIKRANIKVIAGKISIVTFKHEAAKCTLRLLRSKKGNALADTKWTIKDASGDVVFKTNGTYATAILASGSYVALAQNAKHLYQKDFIIESGKDLNVNVLTSDKAETKTNKSDALETD